MGAEPGWAKEESRITCMRMPRTNQSKMTQRHSRPQRPRSFWSAPRIATSGPVQRHFGFEWLCKHNRLRPEPIRFVRLDSEHAQSDGVGHGQRSRFLVLTKRSAASGNENDQKLLDPNYVARVNVSRNAFFRSRSERKHFLWRWYCRKKHQNVKIEIWFMVVCTLIDEYVSSQTFVSYCFCMLSNFAKVFERKVWRVQVAHLHNAARALSSPGRYFQIVSKSWQIFLSLSFILW